MTDTTIIVHPTQSGHVRIVVSSDGPAETLMTPDQARELARRLLWAVQLSDVARRWPTRESERARLVAEVGECCRGADPHVRRWVFGRSRTQGGEGHLPGETRHVRCRGGRG